MASCAGIELAEKEGGIHTFETVVHSVLYLPQNAKRGSREHCFCYFLASGPT